MTQIMSVRGLKKSYPGFELKNVSFDIAHGCITGFIGRNGAGKTTTLKSILGLIHSEGEIRVFDMDMRANEAECKRRIGVVFGEFNYYPDKKLGAIARVYRRFFPGIWDEATYRRCLEQFKLDEGKRVKELSAGMKVKFSLTLALSHGAELLILDEPTSGLDPVSRDELLDIFTEIVADGERSILFSTHITSDLDKCADYIVYIRNGELVMQGDREQIIGGYRLVQGRTDQLTPELEAALEGIKHTPFGFTGLIGEEALGLADGLSTAPADIESIMLYTEKYENAEHEGGDAK